MRKQYINFIKFISILFVINIHLLSKAWNGSIPTSTNFKVLTFIDIMFLVCVPLFIMCSGTIFLNRNDSIKKIIFKYILKIYLIFILFNTLYKTADLIIYQNGSITFSILKRIVIDSLLLRSIYHLWYLKIIIAMYFCIPLLNYIKKNNIKYIDHILLIVLLIFAKITPIIFDNGSYITFMSIFGFILYYYLGYYLDKYANKYYLIIMIPLAIISYIYTYTKTINYSISIGSPSVDHMQYQSYNIMALSILIFIIFKTIKNCFEKEKIKQFTEFVTRNNFYIYLIHGFVIAIFSYYNVINIYYYKHPSIIYIYGILIYVISLIIVLPFTHLLNKYKKSHKFK